MMHTILASGDLAFVVLAFDSNVAIAAEHMCGHDLQGGIR